MVGGEVFLHKSTITFLPTTTHHMTNYDIYCVKICGTRHILVFIQNKRGSWLFNKVGNFVFCNIVGKLIFIIGGLMRRFSVNRSCTAWTSLTRFGPKFWVHAMLCSLKHLYVGHHTSSQVVPLYLPSKLHNQSGIWVGNESIDDVEKLEYIGEQKKNKAHQLLLISFSTLWTTFSSYLHLLIYFFLVLWIAIFHSR